LIVPFQHGVRNVVASLGTALTNEQAKLLGRFARKVVVNYDGDRAGINAAKRAIEVLLPEDFEAKVLVLPDGSDPDEFVRAQGVEEYNKRRGAAVPHIQFVLEQAVGTRNLRNPAQKAEAVEEVLPFVRAVRNSIQKREYFDMMMDALRVEEKGLRQELWKTVSARDSGASAADVKKSVIRAESQPPTVAEQRLLEMLVSDAELRSAVLPQLDESDYAELPTAAIFSALKELDAKGLAVDFSTLGALTEDDPLAADLVPLVLMHERERAEGEATDAFLEEAESCLMTLRLMSYDRRLRDLASEITAADRTGQDALRDQLIMEDFELKRRRTALLPSAGGVTPSS
jgi:DNA primase